MPITPTNLFKGRQYSGEVILQAVRSYLRYPLAYLHVSEILTAANVEDEPQDRYCWVCWPHNSDACVWCGPMAPMPEVCSNGSAGPAMGQGSARDRS